jgi:phosphoglycolate phosphatase
MKNTYSHIIWDWNGTLFNDTGWCIDIINLMLQKRNLKKLESRDDYYKSFCFPIINYYRNVGFDLKSESFEALAAEYIELYHSNNSGNCSLHENVETTLKAIHDMNITQIILSASQIDNLLLQINAFDISQYFDEMLGISDIYAESKIQIGQDYMKKVNVNKAILIGDTLHDYEVAQALNVDCLLIAKGHQSVERLRTSSAPVLDDIIDVLHYLS